MHQFIVNAQSGTIVPVEHNKQKLFSKLLNSYEAMNMSFKITIEVLSKDINQSQVSLYNAFILRTAEHFGSTFNDMEMALTQLHPLNSFKVDDYKRVDKWNTSELQDFINKANALLLEADSDFKF